MKTALLSALALAAMTSFAVAEPAMAVDGQIGKTGVVGLSAGVLDLSDAQMDKVLAGKQTILECNRGGVCKQNRPPAATEFTVRCNPSGKCRRVD